ncbi:MAG: hypothetical protein M2R45_03579 [Verrucomicrobia subdivision 3 bacterium]|nr:hypothetical protein [Limisphaerales bacterium]MCS1414788.1 hypothetical protein [Limisphaerales bacterium]
MFWGLGLSPLGAVQFQVDDAAGSHGTPLKVEIRIADFSLVQAFQFTLSWDPAQFEFMEAGDFAIPSLASSGFGYFPVLGRLTVVWDSSTVEGVSLEDGSVLFSLTFLVTGPDGSSSVVEFTDDPTIRLVVQDLASAPFQAVSGILTVGLPPSIEGISDFSMSEDLLSAPVSISLADDTTSVDQLTISFSSSNPSLISPQGISLSGTGENRELVIEPEPNQSGMAEIGIRVVDQTGGVQEASFVVTVLPINDPPTAVNDAFGLDEDAETTTIDVLANDTVLPDTGETLMILSVSEGSAGGEINHDGTQVMYRPAPDFNGAEEFSYVIIDNGGLTATGRVRIEVNAINDPPTVVNDRASVSEDSFRNQIAVLANDSDRPDENETLVIKAVTAGDQGGTIVARDDLVIYTPRSDFFGIEEFRYIVTDGNGETSEGVVRVEVVGVNDPPVASDDDVSLPEDVIDAFLNVLGNDLVGPDLGETLRIESVGAASSGGTVRIAGGGIRYTPPANFFGIESFEYTISDGNGGVATARVTISVVNDRADAPVARDDRFLVEENSGPNEFALLNDNGNGHDFDPDGDPIALVAVAAEGSEGGRIQLDAAGQKVVYTPASNFVGSEVFSYTISDGELSASGFVFVTVANMNNEPPIARDDRFTLDEGAVGIRLDVLADNGEGIDFDPEGDSLTIALPDGAGAPGGVVNLSNDGQALIYTPPVDFSGLDEIIYSVSDGVLSTEATVWVTVVNVDDDPPVARDDRFELIEDLPNQRLAVLADNGAGPDQDPEGGVLVIQSFETSSESFMGSLTIGPEGRELVYFPAPNFIGEETFTYAVSDGGAVSVATVILLVANVDDDPPVAIDDRFEVDEDSAENHLAVLGSDESGFDWDPEGLPLFISGVDPQGSSGGQLAVSEDRNVLIYTPAENFSGEEVFSYEVSDGTLVAVGQVITSVINVDDDPPVARPDVVELSEDQSNQVIQVLQDNGNGVDFDPEGGEVRVVSVAPQDGTMGSLVVGESQRTVVYTPIPDFIGREVFRYSITDGRRQAVSVVTIDVVNVDNDPPVAQPDRFFALEDDGEIELDVFADNGAGRDSDPDNDPLMIVAASESSEGSQSIRISENRTKLFYEPSGDFFGVDQFEYTISDGVHQAKGAVSVVVARGDNDAPIAQDDAFTVSEDSTGNRLALLEDNGNSVDSDPDGDEVRLMAVHGPGSEGGVVRLDDQGTHAVYTPAPNFTGVETFTYTVSDGVLIATATVTVEVAPVPDPPTIASAPDLLQVDQDSSDVELRLQVEDVDSPASALSLRAVLNDEQLVSTEVIAPEVAGGDWVVRLSLRPGAFGKRTIRLEASDGELTEFVEFDLTVHEIVALEGKTLGGCLVGATAFLDFNLNGVHDGAEPRVETVRDGSFRFEGRFIDFDRDGDGELSARDGHIRMTSGVDRVTGQALEFELRAPLGVSVLSPFSTLAALALERNDVPGLNEAEQLVLERVGLEAFFDAPGSLLAFNPLARFSDDPALARIVLIRLSSLQSLVQQISALVSGVSEQTRERVAEATLRTIVDTDFLDLPQCDLIEDLLRFVASEVEVELPLELVRFGTRVLCEHVGRIERLLGFEGSFSAFLEAVTRLQLANAFAIVPDLEQIGIAGEIASQVRYDFEASRLDHRIQDYPGIDILGDQEGAGKVRFLHRSFCISEAGKVYEPVALVREGGRSGSLKLTITLDGETASSPDDFVDQPIVVQFQDGEVYQEIDLSSVGILRSDGLVEGEETVRLSLFQGGTEAGSPVGPEDSSVLKLIDDDFGGLFEFAAVSFEVQESSVDTPVFLVRRGGNKGSVRLIVSLETGGGRLGAKPGIDFDSAPVAVTFEAGEITQQVDLPIRPDFVIEERETILARLEIAPGQLLSGDTGSQVISLVRIVNDDFDEAPEIEPIPKLVVDEDQDLSVPLRVADDSTPPGDLSVRVTSLAPELITVEEVAFDEEDGLYRLLLRPQPNAFGQTTVEIRVLDAFQERLLSAVVVVEPVNDLPEITVVGNEPIVYVEDEPAVSVANQIEIRDIDSDTLVGASVGISEHFFPNQDKLLYSSRGSPITGTFDANTGVLELTGVASVAEYQAALARVGYQNRSDSPSTLARTVTISVRDEEGHSNRIAAIVSIEAVNDVPVLARLEKSPAVYVENEEPVGLSESILVTTADDQVFTGARVRIFGNYMAGEDTLLVGELAEGISAAAFDVTTGVLSLTGTAGLLAYQDAIRAVRYVNLSDVPSSVIRLISFQVRDAEVFSESSVRALNVVPVNDPPTLADLADLEARPGERVVVPLEVADLDTALESLSIAVASNNPSLISPAQIEVVQRDEGIVMEFEPSAIRTGEASLAVSVSDGFETVTKSVNVFVRGPNQPPRLTGPTDLVIEEDGRGRVLLEIGDMETSLSDLAVGISVDNRHLFPPLSFEMTRLGGMIEILLQPAKDAFGDAVMVVQVSDGDLDTEHHLAIAVEPVNDRPILSVIPNSEADLGSVHSVAFSVSDVETMPANLWIGARALDPLSLGATTFAVQGDQAERSLLINFAPAVSGAVRFEIVIVDADGGTASQSFEVLVHELTFGRDSISVVNVGDGFVEIRWEGRGRLGIASDIEGPYVPIANSESPFRLRVQKTQEYFKIIE